MVEDRAKAYQRLGSLLSNGRLIKGEMARLSYKATPQGTPDRGAGHSTQAGTVSVSVGWCWGWARSHTRSSCSLARRDDDEVEGVGMISMISGPH